jgi:hypothetical protein
MASKSNSAANGPPSRDDLAEMRSVLDQQLADLQVQEATHDLGVLTSTKELLEDQSVQDLIESLKPLQADMLNATRRSTLDNLLTVLTTSQRVLDGAIAEANGLIGTPPASDEDAPE